MLELVKGWMRFVYTVLGIIFRHPVTGVSIVPLLPDGKIILVRRQDNGKWALPGGMIDWGEDILTTVKRELAEETGLELVKLGRLVGVYSGAHRDPRLHSICILVSAEVTGNMHIQDTLEIAEVRGFDLTQIPMDNLSHDYQQQIQDYLQGRTAIA
ncbi:MAG: NUDIX hydrolase [Limnospira sp. PMC 1291.21]|uniref:NUDIX hydrolase, MutT-like mutator protein n=4 Tax=Oscillatoriales TaxID=1150 RepID=A0A9P1NZW6_9CYAN|nr:MULTISPECIES: NUDIX hydrolase [Limnospira]EKD06988.1 NUDIX hydrolase [Arthrospira platensis C1]MDC0839498.1 NUDIX hydrolase [Limnoraphis robusta]MDY7054950.1 NUDIX hydrolase [Limnospira fusiformis LS22]QJB26235.1 NUDIX hydrolase [Limnospira fusiformis SAG 85.79]SMZ64506.1 NUDIX hydrolase [Arthrospira sp. SRM16]